MWEYLAVLVLGFWLGVAIFLYVSCYWLDEILDLPSHRNAPPSGAPSDARPGASEAHVRLERLVARALHHAAALPALHHHPHHHHHHHQHHPQTHTIESSTYEDLLATAILNKVVERYQREGGDAAAGSGASGGRSSGIHSASASPSPEPSPSDRSSSRSLLSSHSVRTTPSARAARAARNRHTTPPLHGEEDLSDWEEGETTDEAPEAPRRVPFPEYGGDLVHRSDDDERDFDEASGGDMQAIDGNWEENWLFQKKKIKGVQSVPVPMLVPNSNAEYRALIGDRHADDTTDLSDNASDTEDDSAHYKSDMKKVLDSKHIIGGKILMDDESDFEPDSLTIIEQSDDLDKLVRDEYERNKDTVDDANNEINKLNDFSVVETGNVNARDELDNGKLMLGVDSGPPHKAEFALNEEIHRTAHIGDLMELNEAINTNGNSYNGNMDKHSDVKGSTNTINHHEREGEYEETVTVPVQRHADSLRRKHFEDVPQVVPTRDTDQEEDLVPGSVAYRERKKWLNYVEMPNNPYSPEAIKKRLSAKSTSSLFDAMTTHTRDVDNDRNETFDNNTFQEEVVNKQVENIKVVNHKKISLTLSSENLNRTDRRSKSPSPKRLRDVLTDEVSQYKRYGRDYYIREAKASSGVHKKGSVSDTSSISSVNKSPSVDSFDREFASPGLLIRQFNTIATNQQYTKFAGNDQLDKSINTVSNNNNFHNNILIEYDDVTELTLFSAKPVVVDDDTDKRFEEILQTAYTLETTTPEHDNIEESLKSPISVDNSYISSSSMEDSIKIYNVQTGEIMKCKPEDTLSVRYEADSYDYIDMADKTIFRKSSDSPSPASDADEGASRSEQARNTSVSEVSELDDLLAHLPKVKELAKKFVSMDDLNETGKVIEPYSKRRRSKENLLSETRPERAASRHVYMHSLTARSISKEFRDELKLSMATPLTAPGGAGACGGPGPDAPEPLTADALPEPGTIKTKLAFFESLKNKFTTK